MTLNPLRAGFFITFLALSISGLCFGRWTLMRAPIFSMFWFDVCNVSTGAGGWRGVKPWHNCWRRSRYSCRCVKPYYALVLQHLLKPTPCCIKSNTPLPACRKIRAHCYRLSCLPCRMRMRIAPPACMWSTLKLNLKKNHSVPLFHSPLLSVGRVVPCSQVP